MPVNHDSWPVITWVPFREQVLVKCIEFLRVRGAGRRGLAPDVRKSRLERRIRYLADGSAQVLGRYEPLLSVHQLPVTDPMVASTDALESNIGSQSIETEEQALLKGCRVQCSRGVGLGKKSVKWVRKFASLSMSSKSITVQRLNKAVLSAFRFGGFGCASKSERGSRRPLFGQ